MAQTRFKISPFQIGVQSTAATYWVELAPGIHGGVAAAGKDEQSIKPLGPVVVSDTDARVHTPIPAYCFSEQDLPLMDEVVPLGVGRGAAAGSIASLQTSTTLRLPSDSSLTL